MKLRQLDFSWLTQVWFGGVPMDTPSIKISEEEEKTEDRENIIFPGHTHPRCGGGVLVETLVRETRGHSAWSRATHILHRPG